MCSDGVAELLIAEAETCGSKAVRDTVHTYQNVAVEAVEDRVSGHQNTSSYAGSPHEGFGAAVLFADECLVCVAVEGTNDTA